MGFIRFFKEVLLGQVGVFFLVIGFVAKLISDFVLGNSL